MRWDVGAWAAIALLLMAAETLIPGAALLWMGFAAGAVFLVVLLAPGMSLLAQVALFAVLSVLSVLIYRQWFRDRDRESDRPLLNLRAQQLIGRVAPLDQAIVSGRGRIQLEDAYWVVSGYDLPAGTRVRVVAVEGMTLKVEVA